MAHERCDVDEKERRAKRARIIYARNNWSKNFTSKFPEATLAAIENVMALLDEDFKLVPDDIFADKVEPSVITQRVLKIRKCKKEHEEA